MANVYTMHCKNGLGAANFTEHLCNVIYYRSIGVLLELDDWCVCLRACLHSHSIIFW